MPLCMYILGGDRSDLLKDGLCFLDFSLLPLVVRAGMKDSIIGLIDQFGTGMPVDRSLIKGILRDFDRVCGVVENNEERVSLTLIRQMIERIDTLVGHQRLMLWFHDDGVPGPGYERLCYVPPDWCPPKWLS